MTIRKPLCPKVKPHVEPLLAPLPPPSPVPQTERCLSQCSTVVDSGVYCVIGIHHYYGTGSSHGWLRDGVQAQTFRLFLFQDSRLGA